MTKGVQILVDHCLRAVGIQPLTITSQISQEYYGLDPTGYSQTKTKRRVSVPGEIIWRPRGIDGGGRRDPPRSSSTCI